MKEGIESIRVRSQKGGIAAMIHHPEGNTEWLAVLCPGYLDPKDYRGIAGLAEELCSLGYTAVRFDPMGTWDSGGSISDYTMTQCLEDVRSVLGFMLDRTKYKRILIGGHSKGGTVSILYAARDPRVSLVLGIMPSLGLGQHEEWRKAGARVSERDLPGDESKKREFKVPYSYAEDEERYDVVKEVKNVKVPVILVAGELDTTVPPNDVKRIFDSANEPKMFVVLPGIGHDYRHSDEEVKIVNGKVLELVQQFQ